MIYCCVTHHSKTFSLKQRPLYLFTLLSFGWGSAGLFFCLSQLRSLTQMQSDGFVHKFGAPVGTVGRLWPFALLLSMWLAWASSHGVWVLLLLLRHSVVSKSLQPHGLQHTRFPWPSLSPRVCSSSCPLSQWCYLTISFSAATFSFCLQSFLESGSFLMSWFFASGPKYWSFSISPSNEYSGSISFRID